MPTESLVVKKGEKMRWRAATGMPEPSSQTRMETPSRGPWSVAAADVDAARLGDRREGEGVDGVDDEVGEDLADLALEAVDAEVGIEVEGAGDFAGDHLAGEEIDDIVQELVEVDFDGAGGVAIEAEGLLGDLGDAGEFGVGGFEQELDGRRYVGVGAGEIDEVGDGFEGVVDLVGDGGGEAAGGGELFALAEGRSPGSCGR